MLDGARLDVRNRRSAPHRRTRSGARALSAQGGVAEQVQRLRPLLRNAVELARTRTRSTR